MDELEVNEYTVEQLTRRDSSLSLECRVSVVTGAYELRYIHIEPAINNVTLRDLLADPFVDQLNTWMHGETPEALAADLNKLLLLEPSEMASGRVPLFGCHCGDVMCGVLSVRISETNDYFVWSDFRFEGLVEVDPEFEKYERVGPFRFPKEEYINTVIAAISLPA
jgi:hypothetical protein